MWLAETAVDLLTLDIMAEHGIRFTVLAPRQAHRVRKVETEDWQSVEGEKVNTKMAYVCSLPSGRQINLFFYDGAIAQDIAFGNLLVSGENFSHRIVSAFNGKDLNPQIVHVATDGETYGHHYKRADMALSYCLYDLTSHGHAEITVYGEYLDKHPPTHEAESFENTSWSCEHGIERWRANCGCNTGAGWRQPSRVPLREDMDWLRNRLATVYEQRMKGFTPDPWGIRDKYIDVVLDRKNVQVERFFTGQFERLLQMDERRQALELLEMQRNAMLMYTSCGWFFDEISGIETTQVMNYASRAMQIAERFGEDLEPEYQRRLERAPTNVPQFQNGSMVYEIFVKPTRMDLFRVAAHYAVSSLFSVYPENFQIYCYRCISRNYERAEAGKLRFASGIAHVRSEITWNEMELSFALIHLGDFNISGGSRAFMDSREFLKTRGLLKEAFDRSDIPGTIREIDRNFREDEFNLWSLFRDEQRKIINLILATTLEGVESSFRQIYDSHYPLMNVMVMRRNPLPKILATTVEFVLNGEIRKLLEADEINVEELEKLVQEIWKWPIEMDREGLSVIGRNAVRRQMSRLRESPMDISVWDKTGKIIRQLNLLKIDMGLWETQNIYFQIGKEFYEGMQKKAEQGDPEAKEWTEYFNRAGDDLGVKIT